MIEIHIPQAGEETKTGKDIVFSILSQQQPLSAIGIVRIARREYHVGLTYQAIKKAIDTLVQQKVLEKEEYTYRINKHWLMNVKRTVDSLLTSYDSGKQIKSFTTDFSKDQYAVYTLANLFDLDNFWDDILIHLTQHFQPKEHRSFVAQVHYTWWLLINLGKETRLFEGFKKDKIPSYNSVLYNTPLNKWTERFYKNMGVHFKLGKEKPKEEEIVDVNVVGDNVIQVHYPKEIVKQLAEFYQKYKTPEEMSLRELTTIVHTPCEIKFTVFKNSEIAQSLREKYLAIFKR
ncbi:MAG: hypothetical protein AABY00_00930 [Nanoarchaeota archaeon]